MKAKKHVRIAQFLTTEEKHLAVVKTNGRLEHPSPFLNDVIKRIKIWLVCAEYLKVSKIFHIFSFLFLNAVMLRETCVSRSVLQTLFSGRNSK